MAIEVAEVRSREEFAALKEEWDDLLSRSAYASPFLSHEWLTTWWTHFDPEARLAVFVARDAGRAVLALPLVETTEGSGPLRLRLLRSPTNEHTGRFHVLVEKGREDAFASLWTHLCERRPRWHVIRLTNVPMDAGIDRPLLETVRAAGGRVGVWHAFDSGFIRTEEGWDAYEKRFSRSVHKRVRNQKNRLGRLGAVRLEILRDEAEVAAALPEAFEIEARSWKGAAGTSIRDDPTLKAFYTDLARAAAARGWMRLSFLRVGDTRVAFEYGLKFGDTVYSLKIGYDAENYGKYSPGRVLDLECIHRCFEADVREFDFLGPLVAAQHEYRPATRAVAWLSLCRGSLRGRLHHWTHFKAKPRLKALFRR